MADRQPFEYPDWCDGPTVDLDIIPTGFPLCSSPTFNDPTIFINNPFISVPEIAPPPMCVCIPTIPGTGGAGVAGCECDSTFCVSGTYIGGIYYQPGSHCIDNGGGFAGTFGIEIIPVTEDCCDPEYEMQFDVDVPCIPFNIATELNFIGQTEATGSLIAWKHCGDCEYLLQLNLDIPAANVEIGISETVFTINYTMDCDPACDWLSKAYVGVKLSDPEGKLICVSEIEFKVPLLARLGNTDDADMIVQRYFTVDKEGNQGLPIDLICPP